MSPKKYIFSIFPVLLFAVPAPGQNLPDLSAGHPAGALSALPLPPQLSATAQPPHVRVFVPVVPVTDAAALTAGSSPHEVQQATEYKDGFNRTVQTVKHYFTTGARPHLVRPVDNRFQQDDINFLPYPSASTAYDPGMFTRQYEYVYNTYAGEQYTGYGISRNISDAGQRAAKTFLPGRSQVGQNRGVTVRQGTNGPGEVRMWGLDGNGQPLSGGAYAAGMLFAGTVYDTMGAHMVTYTDRDGHVVSRTVLQGSQPAGGGGLSPVYGTTTYIYDEMGRLAYILPPKADAASGATVPQAVRDSLCFEYRYDDKGRLSAQRSPGQVGFTEVVYDRKQRPVLRQTPQGRAGAQWEVTFYDVQGRVKATSLITDAHDRAYWQGVMDEGTPGGFGPSELGHYLATGEGEALYPDEGAIAGNEMMSYTWYDDYARADGSGSKWDDCSGNLNFTEALNIAGAEQPVRGAHQHGAVTGGRLRILAAPGADPEKTGKWRETVNYYDKKGRPVFGGSQDLTGTDVIHNHYTGNQYDFAGRLLLSKHFAQNLNALDAYRDHAELSRNIYDGPTGRVTQELRKVDGGPWQVQALYGYDELGRAKRKVLGNYAEVQDLDYNIRGQLTGVNALYTATGNRQGESRSFGELLRYDYGFSVPRYDGRIAGMVWRGTGAANAYAYSYDHGGRLKQAGYSRLEPAGGGYPQPAWRKDLADYTVSGLDYDLDGNILSMDQRSVKPGTGIVDMDQLAYVYGTNSDRLLKVVDGAPYHALGDFDNTNGTTADYTYDADGNLASDANKGITGVDYNHMGKPVTVHWGDGGTISYSYDAAGNKVQERVRSPSKGIDEHRDYVGNFIYGGDSLQYVLTAGGRSVYKGADNTFREEYFVKDHLGNVRSTVTVAVAPIEEYLATYELASANLEGLFFDHHNEIREDNPAGSGHTGRLNAAEDDRRVGTAMLVKVMAGDRVELKVNNYYEGYAAEEDEPLAAGDMLASLVATLTGGEGGALPGEDHNTGMVDKLFDANSYPGIAALLDDITDPLRPRAYLVHVLFDEEMKVVSGGSGGFQVNGNGNWQEIGTAVPLELPVNGYLAVYLSSGTQQLACLECGDVYFDQMMVRFSRGALKEETHYYPHGLPMAAMGSEANNFKANRHKYQGNEHIKELGLDWMDFHARQYDPQIGRFLSVDPLADVGGQEIYSPYAAMGNMPESMIDPMGEVFTISGDAEGMALARSALDSWFGAGNYDLAIDGNKGTVTIKEGKEAGAISGYASFLMAQGAGGGNAVSSAKANTDARNFISYIMDQNTFIKTSTNKNGIKEIDEITFRLPGDWNEFSRRQRGEWCAQFVFSAVDNYLGSARGEDGSYRSPKDFRKYGQVNNKNMGGILKQAFSVIGVPTEIELLGSNLANGYPGVTIEPSGDGNYHQVAIVQLTLNLEDPKKSDTQVYNPASGSIEARSQYFDWENGSGPGPRKIKLAPTYIIKKP